MRFEPQKRAELISQERRPSRSSVRGGVPIMLASGSERELTDAERDSK